MAKYLSQEFVGKSFARLSSRNIGGKTHMERTSALMYFLSVDAAFKYFGVSEMDLNPDILDGKNNRKQVELEFTKLVLVGHAPGKVRQIIELGKIEDSRPHPEKRISSNFLTVPLKRASDQVEPYYYPSRPKCPLFKMGLAATGKKWGISFHENWKANFLAILTTIKGSTPSLDLAIFVCRDCVVEDAMLDIFEVVEVQLKKRFTRDLSRFWIERIDKEKVFASKVETPFSDHYAPFSDSYEQPSAPTRKYSQMNKSELIGVIKQLQTKLDSKNTL